MLRPLCADVRVAVRPGQIVEAPGCALVPDPPPGGEGPLPAIVAALDAAPGGLLVLACDYPAIGTAFFRALLAAARPGHDVALARDAAGRLHPLAARWDPAALPALRRARERGELSVLAALEGARVRVVEPAAFAGLDLERELRNVNRPDELAAWRHAAGGAP